MNPWKTLVVLSLSLVIIGLDTTLLNVALPTLQDEFDASPSSLQWMVDSYLLVLAGLLLVFGTLGDRYGRKLALQTGVTLFGLASLAAVAAGSAGQLIAVRAVMGVGAALIMPATLSIIANVLHGARAREGDRRLGRARRRGHRPRPGGRCPAHEPRAGHGGPAARGERPRASRSAEPRFRIRRKACRGGTMERR
jgi:MFS family permease